MNNPFFCNERRWWNSFAVIANLSSMDTYPHHPLSKLPKIPKYLFPINSAIIWVNSILGDWSLFIFPLSPCPLSTLSLLPLKIQLQIMQSAAQGDKDKRFQGRERSRVLYTYNTYRHSQPKVPISSTKSSGCFLCRLWWRRLIQLPSLSQFHSINQGFP